MVDSSADGGWIPVEDATELADRIEFSDLGFITEITHPLRAAILRRLKNPHTIAEVAAALEVPVTRLYHHFGRLEDSGIITVVATRRVAAVTERRYQVVARNLGVARRFFESQDPNELSAALGSLFDLAKFSLQREIEGGALPLSPDGDESSLSLSAFLLSPAKHRELIARLEAIIEEFASDADEDDPDAVRLSLFIAAHPETM